MFSSLSLLFEKLLIFKKSSVAPVWTRSNWQGDMVLNLSQFLLMTQLGLKLLLTSKLAKSDPKPKFYLNPWLITVVVS